MIYFVQYEKYSIKFAKIFFYISKYNQNFTFKKNELNENQIQNHLNY